MNKVSIPVINCDNVRCVMKIPKYIDDLLKRRTQLAKQLDGICYQLDNWLDKNGVEPDSACYHTGVETYVNPDSSEYNVRQAIEEIIMKIDYSTDNKSCHNCRYLVAHDISTNAIRELKIEYRCTVNGNIISIPHTGRCLHYKSLLEDIRY